jgi:hypothetical protein
MTRPILIVVAALFLVSGCKTFQGIVGGRKANKSQQSGEKRKHQWLAKKEAELAQLSTKPTSKAEYRNKLRKIIYWGNMVQKFHVDACSPKAKSPYAGCQDVERMRQKAGKAWAQAIQAAVETSSIPLQPIQDNLVAYLHREPFASTSVAGGVLDQFNAAKKKRLLGDYAGAGGMEQWVSKNRTGKCVPLTSSNGAAPRNLEGARFYFTRKDAIHFRCWFVESPAKLKRDAKDRWVVEVRWEAHGKWQGVYQKEIDTPSGTTTTEFDLPAGLLSQRMKRGQSGSRWAFKDNRKMLQFRLTYLNRYKNGKYWRGGARVDRWREKVKAETTFIYRY